MVLFHWQYKLPLTIAYWCTASDVLNQNAFIQISEVYVYTHSRWVYTYLYLE